ncbi:unnamed protein product, partial [marine sediment metagenome]
PAILIFDNSGTETILVAYNTFEPDESEYGYKSIAYSTKSTDGGATWSDKVQLNGTNEGRTRGRPILLSNGNILVSVSDGIGSPERQYACISSDGGDSWSVVEMANSIDDAPFTADECSLIETKTDGAFTGGVYAVVREGLAGSEKYWRLTSPDYGMTWGSPTEETGLPKEQNGTGTPCGLIRMSDGTILANYNKGWGDGIWIYQSNDECETWEAKSKILSTGGNYSSLVEISNSKIYVAWCDNGRVSSVWGNDF